MDTEWIMGYEVPCNYFGRIMYKKFSDGLKKTVSEALIKYEAFDQIGGPTIPYIAAWKNGETNMWYEFVGNGLLQIIGGKPGEAAERIRNGVLERRVYKNHDFEAGVRTESLDIQDLEEARTGLRGEGVKEGRVEAVYKLMLNTGGVVWLKDVANIISFADDNANLAFGCLTVVSKEMDSELKNETLLTELKNALRKVRTLNGMLPICAKCKKIRDDKGYWSQVEDYIRNHSKAEFSHGICPDCARSLYPEIFEESGEKQLDKQLNGKEQEDEDDFPKARGKQ